LFDEKKTRGRKFRETVPAPVKPCTGTCDAKYLLFKVVHISRQNQATAGTFYYYRNKQSEIWLNL
jgi:hypothetical protein